MNVVRFNHVEEFLADLTKDQNRIERRMIRSTNRFTASKVVGSAIQHVTVIATARLSERIGDDRIEWIVRLEQFVGDMYDLPDEKVTKRTDEKARAIHEQIEKWAEIRGFVVRGGIYEEGKE